jgi:hypothetical protein
MSKMCQYGTTSDKGCVGDACHCHQICPSRFSKVRNMVKKSKKGHQECMRMFIDVVLPP